MIPSFFLRNVFNVTELQKHKLDDQNKCQIRLQDLHGDRKSDETAAGGAGREKVSLIGSHLFLIVNTRARKEEWRRQTILWTFWWLSAVMKAYLYVAINVPQASVEAEREKWQTESGVQFSFRLWVHKFYYTKQRITIIQ